MQVALKPGQIITNCQVCHMTCHCPCKIANNAEKSQCASMNSDGTCKLQCAFGSYQFFVEHYNVY